MITEFAPGTEPGGCVAAFADDSNDRIIAPPLFDWSKPQNGKLMGINTKVSSQLIPT